MIFSTQCLPVREYNVRFRISLFFIGCYSARQAVAYDTSLFNSAVAESLVGVSLTALIYLKPRIDSTF